jgi:hypothetical protein
VVTVAIELAEEEVIYVLFDSTTIIVDAQDIKQIQ